MNNVIASPRRHHWRCKPESSTWHDRNIRWRLREIGEKIFPMQQLDSGIELAVRRSSRSDAQARELNRKPINGLGNGSMHD
jgi:hypothetical protein